MIVDSSALIAILRDESDQRAYAAALHAAQRPVLSAPTFLEASVVVGRVARPRLDELIAAADVSIEAFTHDEALVAREAYLRYGKGSGSPAGLNFGDCISYAAATVRGEPLLFRGGDFTHTDVASALPTS